MIAARFSALGHMIRDGFPALGSTHLARLAGGLVVFGGCWTMLDWLASAVLASAATFGLVF